MQSEQALRFGVRGLHRPQSAIWRLWTELDETYLAARALAGMLKISMHSSGIWRAAWTEQSGIVESSGNRLAMKWKRPKDFTEGWTQGATVLIPDSPVRFPFEAVGHDDPRIHWSLPPGQGMKVNFTVLFSRPGIRDINRVLRAGDQVVGGPLPLQTGGLVWLSRREAFLTDFEREYVAFLVTDPQINTGAPSSIESANLFVLSEETYPVVMDIALGLEHVRLDPTPPPRE